MKLKHGVGSAGRRRTGKDPATVAVETRTERGRAGILDTAATVVVLPSGATRATNERASGTERCNISGRKGASSVSVQRGLIDCSTRKRSSAGLATRANLCS